MPSTIKPIPPLPPFVPLPRFILRGEYSINAKLLYALLLGRTQLSQKSGWVSEDGDVYVIYTIRQMANDLNRSEERSRLHWPSWRMRD